jgi:hypothetical protein
MLTPNETYILAKLNTLEHVNAQMLIIFSEMASYEDKPSILEALFNNLRVNLTGEPFVLEGKGEGAREVQAEMGKQLDHFEALIDFYQRNTKLN